MKRRAALGLLLTGAAWRVPAAGQAARPQDTTRADRLYDPSKVQQRAVATERDNDETIKALEGRLKCTCGCNLDIYTCRTTDFTCTYSPALHREVLDLLDAGKTPDDVVAALVSKYGEQMLMAPKPEGFNLAGYLLPGAVVALAGSLLVLVLARRARMARLRTVAAPADPAGRAATGGPGELPADPVEDERLRRALAEVED